MIGLVISLLIVGWFSAQYLVVATGGSQGVQETTGVAPAGGAPLPAGNMTAPINKALELASEDKERQKMMEELIRQQ
jgi:hypothetical protein